MFRLPKTTEFDKRIPKQKFYEKIEISPDVKKAFVEQIKIICWRNKIASTTVNIQPGIDVKEIEVIEIRLNEPVLNEAVLKQLDREIPYHILFILEYEGKYQAWIGYKEFSSSKKAFKVNKYYNTQWLSEEELPIKIDGLDLDRVYENLIRQIAGDKLQKELPSESIKESVQRDEERLKLQKAMDKLKAKIRKEKQLNKQMEMKNELRKLEKALEEL